jgi:hypothetical protein
MDQRAGFVVGLCIVLCLAAPASPRAWSGTWVEQESAGALDPDRVDLRHEIWLDFADKLVSSRTIGSLMNDPVVAFGAVLDDTGHNVDGEIWVTVSRGDRAIFYHLSEAPASGSGSYSGFTVVSKGIHTQRMVNYGSGEDVPVIGNETDAFVISTTELYVSSRFLTPGVTVQTLSGAPAPAQMVRVGSVEYAANIPAAATASRKVGARWLGADGAVIHESVSVRSASGPIDCVGFGTAIGTGVDNAIDVAVAAFLAAAVADGWFAVGVAAREGFPQVAPGDSAAITYAGWIAGNAGQSFRQLTGTAKNFMTPLAAGAAANACARANLGLDALIGLVPVEVMSIETTCSMQSVCTDTGSQWVGSTSTTGTTVGPDGGTIESIEVTGVRQDVCTDSEVVLVCG